MSASDTAPSHVVRPLVRRGTAGRLVGRLVDAWPLAVIAVGGLLSLCWMAALAWSALELVIWLV